MSQAIGQRYQILDEIGSGGMGIVYRAMDTATGQTVALKQLRTATVADQLSRFRREGEALRDLNHPNIVRLLDTFQDNDDHYLVMEYVSGGDLTKLIEQPIRPIPMVLQIAIDLVDALTRAHKIGIIHRDLKPANILLADDGTVRLTDFGIAHIAQGHHTTEDNVIVGTVAYMAPEVLQSQPTDPRADIWAFGVILFELLTRQHPFMANTPQQTIMNILVADIPPLEKLRSDVPVALADLIYRMLERNPQARIGNIRVVGAELAAIGDGNSSVKRLDTSKTDDATIHVIADAAVGPQKLPAQSTPFVGREDDVAEARRLLQDVQHRVITVLGPGGTGKTRLAIEVAQQTAQQFPDGVFFVDLASLSDIDSIIPTIRDVVGFAPIPGQQSLLDQLLMHLATKRCLLVLDNYEHLIEGAHLVHSIVQATKNLRLIVTSRQKLNLSVETVMLLGGMDFPTWETPEDGLRYAAVKLFVQSAQRVDPSFELTKANMDYVARVCKLVEGLPLGILLAASWLSALSVEEIATEITNSADFLSTDLVDLPERQHSIRNVFDYSWQLLTETEQYIFMKLSVFRGGFDRNAAQAVAEANLQSLRHLVNKSLLQRDPDTGRYTIHELIRQYAGQKLGASGHEASTKTAHLMHFNTTFQEMQREVDRDGRMAVKMYVQMDQEYANLQAAVLWSVFSAQDHVFCEIFRTYDIFVDHRTRLQEWKHFLDEIDVMFRSRTGAVLPDAWAMLWASYTLLYSRMVRYELAAHNLEKALAIGDQIETPWVRWSTLIMSSFVNDFPNAIFYLEQALAIAATADDRRFLFSTYNGLGIVYQAEGAYDEALKYLQRAVELAQLRHDYFMVGVASHNIALIHLIHERYEDAVEIYERNESLVNDAPAWSLVVLFADYCLALLMLDRRDDAREKALRLLDAAEASQLRYAQQIAVLYLAEIMAREGQIDLAVRWYAETYDDTLLEHDDLEWDKAILTLLALVNDDDRATATTSSFEVVVEEVKRYFNKG